MRRAPATNHRPLLLLRGQGEAQLPGPAQRVPDGSSLPVRDALGSPGGFSQFFSVLGVICWPRRGFLGGLWPGWGALLVHNPLPSSSVASSRHRMAFASGVSSSNSWIPGVKWGGVNGFWLFTERFVGSDVALSWSRFAVG